MAGLAVEAEPQPRLARDSGDHSDGEILLLQDRPLLDVGLDVAQQCAAVQPSLLQPGGLAAEAADRFLHRHSIRVLAAQIRGVKCSGHDPAAQKGALVSHAFLIGKANDFQREWQASLTLSQLLHAGDGQDYSQRAIEFPRVAHRVQVRPHQKNPLPSSPNSLRTPKFGLWTVDRGLWTASWVAPDHVSDRILAHRHARLAYPGPNQVIRTAHFLGAERASQSLPLLADPAQRLDPPHNV